MEIIKAKIEKIRGRKEKARINSKAKIIGFKTQRKSIIK